MWALAERQWAGYVGRPDRCRLGRRSRCRPADDCPDGVFVEDTVVMVGDTAVITNPGADERKPEIDGTAATLTRLGYPGRARSAAARLDGGDVLKVGTHDLCRPHPADRTRPASRPSAGSASRCGYTVIAVPVTKVLHLKSAVTALPDGTVIGYPPLVDDPAFWPHFRPMPEEAGSHVVDLGDGRLLMAASAPRSAELIADFGYTPSRLTSRSSRSWRAASPACRCGCGLRPRSG